MRRGLSLLALAQFAIGAAAIFARFALGGGGPIAISAARLSLAAIPIVILALLRGAYRVRDVATERRLAYAAIALALHFALWIASLRYASVAVSTLLVCSTPIWTELYAVARTRRARPIVIASVLLALAGVAIVVGLPSKTETPLGIALAIGGAIAIAIYLVLVRASDARYGTLDVIARTYPGAAIVLLALAFAFHDPFPAGTATLAWGGIIAMALISQLFGHTALNAAVRRLSPTFVATATLIEPAIAGALAAVIFHERLTSGTLAGAIIILTAIGIAVRAERAATTVS
jgi:drug/metabolite transporter (DMT)-like permease